MSLLRLPEIRADQRLGSTQFDLRTDAVDRWEPEVRAAADDDNSISIYDSIGEGWDGNGVTAKRISAALRSLAGKDVVVNVNSPGGDFFEGVAIYNLLRAHKGKVTVRVLGLAASAASVIAMAGDEIQMGEGAFLMIHNAWAVAVGNRHDLADVAAYLEPFDQAMAQMYAARTGKPESGMAKLMDEETWIDAEKAIEEGFATGKVPADAIGKAARADTGKRALALVDASMAKAGMSRTTRRDTLKALFSGTPRAAEQEAMPSAGADLAAALRETLSTIKGTSA